MENTLAQQICKRYEAMESLRQPHVDTWRRCYKYSYPLRMHGFYNDTVTAEDGLDTLGALTDSTTTESVRVFAAHLIDGMTPSNALWFGIDVGQESDDEKRWLSSSSRVIWENIHNSNFDAVSFEAVIDEICAGWFVMYIDEAEEGGYHFEQWPISECFVASTRPGRPIDTIYRKFSLRADQAINQYGEENVSDKIREAIAQNKPHEKFEFIHAIYPRKNYVVGARLAKNLPFASCHIELTDKHLVRESGYHEFPCAVPRWMLIPATPYAVGPVYDALPDAATINKVKELELDNLDIAVGGMYVAVDDGVLNPRSIKIGSRRVIVANDVESIKELRSGADFNVAFISEDRIQSQIKKLLLADVLPPLEQNQPRTATELNIRMAYIRQMLGPIFGRLQSEYLQVLITRCFGIAYRAGVLGQAPQSLQNRTWHIKYKSPLARAQQLAESDAIDQYGASLIMQAEIKPEALDNLDWDKANRYKAEALGVPAELIPDTKTVAKIRLQREQARQELQQEQIGNQVLQTAGQEAAKRAVGG